MLWYLDRMFHVHHSSFFKSDGGLLFSTMEAVWERKMPHKGGGLIKVSYL